MPREKFLELVGNVGGNFQTHFVTETALRQFTFHGTQQIVHFFIVDKQITVARDTKLITTRGLHAGKQVADIGANHARQQHEFVVAFGSAGRQTHHPGQSARRLHNRPATAAPEGIATFQRHNKIQTLVQDARERMRGVQPHGRHHRHNFTIEVALQPRRLTRRELARQQSHALILEGREQYIVQHAVLFGDQLMTQHRDASELLRR